jgi:adenosylmethionine-8-amino-7-oxononanoate aminotransferase
MKTNSNIQQQDKEYIWHPYTSLAEQRENIVVESAEGVYLHTEDNRRILDAVSSWWVNIHGHAHPYIAQKIAAQAASLEHVIFAGFTHRPAVELAQRLLTILPGEHKKVFYSDNGSTAVEVAIKMAIQYGLHMGREQGRLVALEGAFHGDTFGAMSVSGRGLFTEHFKPYLFGVDFIPFPSEGREEETIRVFEEKVKTGEIIAFIYEPLLQGAAGMRIYSPEVLRRLIEIARQHNVVCIADEVMTGFGRTGKLFASAYMDIYPDIYCLSKALTGGVMAMGATTCNEKIMSAFMEPGKERTFFHGHSFTANPIACAASNASMDLLLTEEYQQKIDFIYQSHLAFREKVFQHPMVKQVKVLGTVLSLEINTKEDTGYTNALRDELYSFFLSRDILMRPLGNILYILPPYIIVEKELTIIYKAIVDLLHKLER